MANHIVDQIADQFFELLFEETDAHDRVYRDRSEQFEALEDLPAIDIRIGADDPEGGSANGPQDSMVRINVDLYVANNSRRVSASLLELRKQTYMLLMASAPQFPLSTVVRINHGGAEEVKTQIDGSVPLGYVQTVYFVTYRHSLTDPSV